MILIRERAGADVGQLVEILHRVHERDGYPIHVPDAGLESFLVLPRSEAAWVAVDEHGVLLGHVALNSETTAAAMDLVQPLAGHRTAIYVSRLFVDTQQRKGGVGRRLLDHACDEARRTDRFPALDVLDIPAAAPAIALYQGAGWAEIGRVTFDLLGDEFVERVFIAPPL